MNEKVNDKDAITQAVEAKNWLTKKVGNPAQLWTFGEFDRFSHYLAEYATELRAELATERTEYGKLVEEYAALKAEVERGVIAFGQIRAMCNAYLSRAEAAELQVATLRDAVLHAAACCDPLCKRCNELTMHESVAALLSAPAPEWIRQESCSQCDGDGCSMCSAPAPVECHHHRMTEHCYECNPVEDGEKGGTK